LITSKVSAVPNLRWCGEGGQGRRGEGERKQQVFQRGHGRSMAEERGPTKAGSGRKVLPSRAAEGRRYASG
jgi:hypothetical protein